MSTIFDPTNVQSIVDYYQFNPSDFNRYAVSAALIAMSNAGNAIPLSNYLSWLSSTDDEYSSPS